MCIVENYPLNQLSLFLMRNSVAPSSQHTYEIGWRIWCGFAGSCGFDPLISETSPSSVVMHPFSSFQIAAAVAFIAYCFFSKKLSPATIATYLASVGYYYRLNGISAGFLHSDAVDMARSGASLLHRQLRPVRDTSTLPCSLEMILTYQRSVPAAYEKHHAVITGMLLGFSLLLRVSEYVALPTSSHFLRSQDVTFVLHSGAHIPSHMVSEALWPQVTKVVFLIRSAKNDSEGSGNRMVFSRKDCVDSTTFCICRVTFDWATRARLVLDDAFLSYRQLWQVSYKDINTAVKEAAVMAGLNPARFSTHSLRYGGASALAAAGTSYYSIQQYGRWKSSIFLQYLKLSEEVFNRAFASLSHANNLSTNDIRLMFPNK